MNQEKQQLIALLEEIATKQKSISACHDFYLSVEKVIEDKRKRNTDPLEMEEILKKVNTLNREYEQKCDIFYEELNAVLLKGHDLAKKIGHEVQHDYKKLWDYMTQSTRYEVDVDRVMRDITYIKGILNK